MPRPLAPGRFVARMFEEAVTPIFALDAERKIVLANRALSEWLGLDTDQLIGRTCSYTSSGEDPLESACAGLCPPPEAFTGEATDGAVSRLAGSDRPFERRRARFILVVGSEVKQALLLVLVQAADTVGADQRAEGISPERLHGLLLKLRSDLGRRYHISQLIGQSEAIERVREQVRIAAEARARVLVTGPPGSGREHVARTIHYAQRSTSIGAIVPIVCGLVDAEQMQSSLASLLRQQYDQPTDRPPAALLLDVDRLRPDAQQELAGFLHLPNIELHTLATGRRSLQRLAAKGKFRRDLAYALSTLAIGLPPLAHRREDIPLLAQHFVEGFNAAGGRQLSGLAPAALELLSTLPWPGNIDDLAQAVREACERAAGSRVGLADLPDWVHLAKDSALRAPRDEPPIELDAFMAEIEKELLARAMRRARGNKSKAAQLLGLTRQRLLRRLAQHGLIAPVEAEESVVFEPLPEEP